MCRRTYKTDSERSGDENKKIGATIFSSIANIVSRLSTYSNMQENLIDCAVANSATYRDAKEEAKKKVREGEREREKGME